MAASFGARLKAQRERQQVTLETIAGRTKIRLTLLEDLERDDVSRWPGAIFRRSYFRSYAAAIGLDPELTLREFLALYPEPTEDPSAAILPDVESAHTSDRPKTRLHYLLASAIGAVSKPFDKERNDHARDDTAGRTGDISGGKTGSEIIGGFDGEVGEEVEQKSHADVGEPRPGVQVDLPALAKLCTRIVEAGSASDFEVLLGEAVRTLQATGIIVWPWDPVRGVLVPSLSHGYPTRTLARLPTVAADANNSIGAAFRSSARQVVSGSQSVTSAIVVPLTTPRGCVGVLAVELANGLEQDATVQALAEILAAQLSLPVEAVQTVQAEPPSRHAIA
jgi:GAF domain-containing protein